VVATGSLHGSVEDGSHGSGDARLFRLLHCDRPLAGSARHDLAGV